MSSRIVAMAACLLLLASCGDGGSESFTGSGDPGGSADAIRTGEDFFDFSAPRLGGGGQVTGSELQGKDVALWFWAPW